MQIKSDIHRMVPSSIKEALPQITAVTVKNFILLVYGMTLGFPTILIPSLSGNVPNEKISLSDEQLSWIGSLNLICVPLGCIFSGAIAQPFGRRRAMQVLNIPFLASWLTFYFSTKVWHIFAALCLTGITGGLLEAPVLTYVAEITQPHLRGILSSTSAVAVTLGVLLSFLLGTFLPWKTTALVNCTIPIATFFLLMFVPESPHWLISKNRFNEAKQALAWLRGWTTSDDEKIQEEFHNICKQFNGNFEENIQGTSRSTENDPIIKKKSKLQMFADRSFVWPFALVALTFFLGHFSGSSPLQVYAIQIFVTLAVPIDKYYATILMGVVQLFGGALCASCISFFGKRIVTITSLIGSGCCFIIVATYSYINDINYLQPPTGDAVEMTSNWVPVVFLVSSAFLSSIGIKVLPWILIGEVYSSETKATGAGLSGGLGYIFGFAANKSFLSLVTSITLPGVFWLYGVVALVGTLLIYFMLPETEGKTLFEISEHFAGRSKLGNAVKRSIGNVEGASNKGYEEDEKVETRF